MSTPPEPESPRPQKSSTPAPSASPKSTSGSMSPPAQPGASMSPPAPPSNDDVVSIGSVMDCTSDPALYTTVSIHTAKCAICDLRNLATMRRCPGCTYQVCTPCFDARNGTPLVHGNLGIAMALSSLGLPVTPVRRKILNRADGGVSGAGTATSSSGAATSGASNKTGRAKRKAGASSDSPTPATNAKKRAAPKRSKKSKVKSKAQVMEHSDAADVESPTDDDDNFTESRPSSKRRKTLTGSKIPTTSNTGVESLTLTSEVGSQQVEESAAPGTGPGRIGGDSSIQELLELHGVDRPGNRYIEHLLSRQQPICTLAGMPTVNVPPGYFQPRPSAAEIHNNFQTKAKAYLQENGAYSNATMSGQEHQMSNPPKTIREYLDLHKSHQLGQIAMDKDIMMVLQGALIMAARPFLAKANESLPAGIRRDFTFSLDSAYDSLSDPQRKELEQLVADTTSRIVQQFGLEAGHMRETPTKSVQESAIALANMSGKTPPIGLFSVTPPRSRQENIKTTPAKPPQSSHLPPVGIFRATPARAGQYPFAGTSSTEQEGGNQVRPDAEA